MRAERDLQLRRVVLDTNVWISAALTAAGPTSQLARRVLEIGRPVFTRPTFTELETRIWRPKFDRYLSMELRRRILHDLEAVADWVEIPQELAARQWSRDADDDAFVRAALAAGAPMLVTGDADLLEMCPVEGLRIVTPAQALREWS